MTLPGRSKRNAGPGKFASGAQFVRTKGVPAHEPSSAPPSLAAAGALVVQDVVKAYGGRPVLRGVSFTVAAGRPP